MANTQTVSAEDKRFNRNKWLFGISGIGRDMAYQLIGSFLLTYIQFGVSMTAEQFLTISLLIGVVGRIWDAVNDPMMGAIIEGTHMKMGKFRPWILIGAVCTGACILAMFNLPDTLGGWGFVAVMGVLYLLWESSFTMNDIGYWSMLASLSSKKEQRNSATMLTVVFAGVGAFIAQGLVTFLAPGNVRQAYSLNSVIITAVFVFMQVGMALLIKERPRAEMEVNEKISLKRMWQTIKSNDQVLWMTLSMLFYSVGSGLLVALAYNLYYLEIGYNGDTILFIVVFGVVNIAAQVFYPMLAKKLGRRRLQKISVIVACVGYLGVALLGWTDILPFNLLTLSLFGVLVFSGQAIFYMASIINMTNCVEYNEYKQGERNEAVVSTLRPFMAKMSDALKMAFTTVVLLVSGVYLLSQNISAMEVQKKFFDQADVANKAVYVSTLQGIYKEYAAEIVGKTDSEVQAINAKYNKELKGGVLANYQIEAQYMQAILDMYVDIDGDGVAEDYTLGDLNDTGLLTAKSTAVIRDKNHNVADNHFYGNRDLGMRLWVRAAVSVVPAVLIVVALVIQNKKFIIDEEYYDMMLAEIDKRNATTATQGETQTEA